MGIFSSIRNAARVSSSAPARIDMLASPWAEGQLQSVVFAEAYGLDLDALPLTRAEAMRVPAVVKARNLLISTIAPLPVRVLDTEGQLAKQPTWATRTDAMSPWHRMAATVDDLIFYGASVWTVTRGADGFPLAMDHLPVDRWSIRDGDILIDGEPVDESEVIYIPGPHTGLLEMAARTIRGARDREVAWTQRVRNPITAIEIRETNELNLSREEIDELVAQWTKAKRSPDGAVGFTPYGIELEEHGSTDPALFVSGRNAVRADIGAFLGVPAALMDASLSEASLTYSTQEGQRSEYLTYCVPLWTAPIEGRLSMDDVVPRGQRTRFDTGELIAPAPTPTGAPTDD
ncbi:hypothetical protein ABID81_002970 [Frigoribacterium sp. PvP054]|uniref:phage portal protein n=1 Tax=Frigoribacterium sp. PvP054 TaxID=3156438 RepID=UPI003393E4C2